MHLVLTPQRCASCSMARRSALRSWYDGRRLELRLGMLKKARRPRADGPQLLTVPPVSCPLRRWCLAHCERPFELVCRQLHVGSARRWGRLFQRANSRFQISNLVLHGSHERLERRIGL